MSIKAKRKWQPLPNFFGSSTLILFYLFENLYNKNVICTITSKHHITLVTKLHFNYIIPHKLKSKVRAKCLSSKTFTRYLPKESILMELGILWGFENQKSPVFERAILEKTWHLITRPFKI
jgi:hypothetical protein